MRLYFDLESNSKNPYSAEMIEAYFLQENGIEYLYQSQIDNWSEEAEKIHGISHLEMMSYPTKKIAISNLVKWLKFDCELIVYANPQSELGYLLYDEVVLKMHLMDHFGVDRPEKLPFKITSLSCHSLAKECDKLGLIDVLRNPETNRKSFTQENVYFSVFGEKYISHRAKSDVIALKRLYEKLMELKESNTSIVNNSQMILI